MPEFYTLAPAEIADDECRSSFTTRQLSIMIDRVEAAIADGRLQITAANYAKLLAVLFPEDFPPRKPTPRSRSSHIPGSAGKVLDFLARMEAGEDLWHPNDPVLSDRLALVAGALLGSPPPDERDPDDPDNDDWN